MDRVSGLQVRLAAAETRLVERVAEWTAKLEEAEQQQKLLVANHEAEIKSLKDSLDAQVLLIITPCAYYLLYLCIYSTTTSSPGCYIAIPPQLLRRLAFLPALFLIPVISTNSLALPYS